MENDQYFMKLALTEAKQAEQLDEVPVGAVLVDQEGNIIATGHNETIKRSDPTAHAEILVLRKAGQQIGNYRLLNTTLYATLEPCVMCMGALLHARVQKVVFGAADPKWGGAGSLYNMGVDDRLNHQIELVEGVCREACRTLIRQFFKNKR